MRMRDLAEEEANAAVDPVHRVWLEWLLHERMYIEVYPHWIYMYYDILVTP